MVGHKLGVRGESYLDPEPVNNFETLGAGN